MAKQPLSEYMGVRVTAARRKRISQMAEDYRVDESEVIRRLLDAGEEAANPDVLFSDEIKTDRKRELEADD